ncbi:MAG: histidine kinase [Actinomycetota bacterium]
MTTTAGPLGDERRRRLLAGAAAVVGAFVAMGEGGFRIDRVVLLAVVAAAFVARARWARLSNLVIAVPALVIPTALNYRGTEVEFALFLLILAVTLIASIETDRARAVGYIVVAIATIIGASLIGPYDWAWVNWASAIALSGAFGVSIHRYDQLLLELRATQAELIDQAALIERRRIARDVHDLIGHSLSVVMLHVAGARRLVRSDPDEATRALLQAEDAGRASMAEVRRSVGLMRADDELDSAPLADMGDLVAVVERYRAAGLAVSYEQEGPIDTVTGPIAVACHRIVQEALTNVARHAPGAGADLTVTVDVERNRCRLRVADHGGPRSTTDGRGLGLIGMRERAQSIGGTLHAGPSECGWVVEAELPLDVADPVAPRPTDGSTA